MPHLISLSTNEKLRELLARHAHQNHTQIAEIAAICERHGQSPGNDQCKAMAGLIEGGTAHLEGVRIPHIRDLMMIAHCLRIACYEMAAYQFTTLLSARLWLLRECAVLSELLAQEKDMAAALLNLEPDLFALAHS